MSVNVQIMVRNGDVAHALRRFKKAVGIEGVIADVRNHTYYTPPAQKRRAKHRRVLHRAKKLAKKAR